ncbi:hypothetical protein [Novipirellula rosea]|uniref:Uncharacterized protein n=1 Tax=Novipirellula rosea TaxID=1031540 RepID=A0ABP8NI46_9BACT
MFSRKCELDLAKAKSLVRQWAEDDIPVTGEHVSDEEWDQIDETGPGLMFDYFNGKLSSDQVALVERYATISEEFREDLLTSGRIVVGRLEDAIANGLSWREICDSAGAQTAAMAVCRANQAPLRLALSNTLMAAASSESVSEDVLLGDNIRMEVFEEEGNLVFDITSSDPQSAGQLIGIHLSNDDLSIVGYVLLRMGKSGVVSGSLEIDRNQLAGNYDVVPRPVQSHDLAVCDTPTLEKAIRADHNDPDAMQSWKSWVTCVRQSDDADALAPLLDRLESELKSFS